MNTLRLLTNVLRTLPKGSQCCIPNRWNTNEMCVFMERAASHVFIRNATTTRTTVGQNDYKSSCLLSDHRGNWYQPKCQMFLIQKSLNTSALLTSLPPCSKSEITYCRFSTKKVPDRANKSDAKSAAVADAEINIFAEGSKLGLFARFKLMYKMYWYVLIPVHVVTSMGWMFGFYYLSKSGVDVPALLQYVHISPNIIEKVQSSSLGHWAVAYLCYKVSTPLRYAVTLGGTTVSIKYLVQQGYIKPIPTKDQIIQMYTDKKAQRAADKANKESQEEK